MVMWKCIQTGVRERFREFTEGNVIRTTQISGEEKHKDGFRYHLADNSQYSKARYTGKLELMLP